MADEPRHSDPAAGDPNAPVETDDRSQVREGDLAEGDESRGTGARSVTQTVAYQGPFPPPSFLREYKNIDPEYAERAIKWNENEQGSRHRHTSRGQWMAFGLGISGIAAAVIVGVSGDSAWAPIGGAIIATSVFALIGGMFLASTSRGRK